MTRGNIRNLMLAAASLFYCNVTQPALAEDTYKIGFAGSISGFLATCDDPVLRGMQLAADEMNKEGGIAGKYKIEILVVDSKSDPAQAQVAGSQLIDGGAQFIIGPCAGDIALATAQLAHDAGLPLISSVNADSFFVSKVGHGAFLIHPGAVAEGKALADYAAKARNLKTAYVVTSKDLVFTQQTSDGFAKEFEAAGGKVLQTDYVKLWQPSQAAIVNKIKSFSPRPDVIMSSQIIPDMPGFIRELRAAGLDTPVLLNDGNDSNLLFSSGTDLGDVTVASVALATPGSPFDAFNQLYKEKNGKVPESSFVGAGGDIIALINKAVETAGSTDSKAVTAALGGIEDFQAVTGKYTYKDKNGVPSRNFLMIVPAEDGKSFKKRNTVMPDGSVN